MDLRQKPMLVLEAGYWGSNMATLGVSSYRGYHVCVDDGDMGMPVEGGPYRIGIYANSGETEFLANQDSDSGFDMDVVCKDADKLIDRLDGFNFTTMIMVSKGIKRPMRVDVAGGMIDIWYQEIGEWIWDRDATEEWKAISK
jgi:hypothetical protein